MANPETSTTADLVFSQKSKKTNSYGTPNIPAAHVESGNFIHTLRIFYSATNEASNNSHVSGLWVVFDNEKSKSFGSQGDPFIDIALYDDTVTLIKVRVESDQTVSGLYLETLKGEVYSNPTDGDPMDDNWTSVTTRDDTTDPLMMLTGITTAFDNNTNKMLGIRFHYKEDIYRYQAISDIIYSNWDIPQLRTIDGISSGTATNLTNGSQEFSLTFAEDLSATLSLEFSASVESATKVEGEVSIPFIAKGEVEETVTVGLSMTVGGSVTKTKSFSCETRVAVEPGQTVNARTTVESYIANGQFTSIVSNVYAHAGAVSRTETGTAILVQGKDVAISYETLSQSE